MINYFVNLTIIPGQEKEYPEYTYYIRKNLYNEWYRRIEVGIIGVVE